MSVKHKISKTKKTLNKKKNLAKRKIKSTTKNLSHSKRIRKDKRARKKAETLAKLPKSRLKRFAYYLHPGRAFRFWFSKRGLILGLKLTGVFIAVMIFLAISLFAYYRREIDADPTTLQATVLEQQTTKFYDKTGEKVIYNLHGDTDRTWVELDNISDFVEDATVSVEDKDFYHHGGFSFSGFFRSLYYNAFQKSDSGHFQGGSTITQQFVKNALLSNEQTVTRKIKELILSLEIERLYTKDEILEFYLNQIPYGGTEYGVEAASQSFFGKSASDLTIAESALLASLPQAPSALSPYGDNTDALLARQQTVIGLMQEQGYITQEQADEALKVDILDEIIPLEEKNQFSTLIAPHFVIEVQKQLEDMFNGSDIFSSGLKVTTSLDYDLQKKANAAIKQNMKTVIHPANGRGSGGDNAALVAVDVETGQISAMVGSRDYNYPGYGAFNAALAKRQPGSSFKPFDYSQLFYSERWGPDSVIYDTPASFGNYKPHNFDYGYRGMMLVRQAIGESRNIPAVKAMHIAGVDNVLDLARAMGNKSLGEDGNYLGLSAALGAGEVKLAEHAQAYSTFARGGEYLPPVYILKVENSAGEVLYEWEKPEPERVLDEQIAYLMTDILLDDNARSGTFGHGNPRLVVPGLTHTVKTGTTNGSTDGWMMGYTKYYAIGVWVGNHDNKPMDTITSWQTGPIFTQFMREAHKDLKNVPIFSKVPAGIKSIKIDSDTGYAATDKSKHTRVGIFPSWHVKQLPTEAGASYVIDTVSGNLATECTPELAKEEITGSKLWPEILPNDVFFANWSKAAGYAGAAGAAPEETDNVHLCSDNEPVISIESIDQLGSGDYKVNVAVTQGTHPLDKLVLTVGGDVKSKDISASGNYSFDYSTSALGSITFQVQVIDDVLYSGNDSESVVANGEPIDLTSPSSGDSASNIIFEWTPAPSADTYLVCWNIRNGSSANDGCSSTNAPDTDVGPFTLTANKKYDVVLKAYDDSDTLVATDQLTFTPN